MRVENIRVTLDMRIPIDAPDENGIVYSHKAFYEICKKITERPITVRSRDCMDSEVVGFCERCERISDGVIRVHGVLFHGGTCERVETDEQGHITSMEIMEVGLCQ